MINRKKKLFFSQSKQFHSYKMTNRPAVTIIIQKKTYTSVDVVWKSVDENLRADLLNLHAIDALTPYWTKNLLIEDKSVKNSDFGQVFSQSDVEMTFFLTYLFHSKFASRVISRHFALLTYSNLVPLMKIGCGILFLFMELFCVDFNL